MASHSEGEDPLFLLVDDDEHSAYFLTKTLGAVTRGVRVDWVADAALAESRLDALDEGADRERPELIIVDLKANSHAASNFIGRIDALARRLGIPVVAMAGSLERYMREALIRRGAAAVFERSPDLDLYRSEVGSLVDFWFRVREPQSNSA